MALARPRLAIIGGGGAMGRLFARYLAPSVRELYLLDFFGVGDRPASLAKTLADLSGVVGSAPDTAAVTSDGATWRFAGAVDAHSTAAAGRLGRASPLAASAIAVAGASTSPAAILGALSDPSAPDATLLFAAQPDHARDLLPRADVVLFALGFENPDAFARVVRPYASALRPGALLVDLGSTKTGPMEVLEREIPRTVDLLGAHPLFGPTVTDLTGLIVAAIPSSDGRPRSPWHDWFLDQLARLRMIVTPTSAAEHDDAMAFVQALTHFALLAFAYTFVRLDRDPIDLLAFRTPVFEPLLYLAARVAYLARSTPETYRAIQAYSTRPDARIAFLDAARELLEAIESADEGAAGERLAELFRRYGGPWSPEGRDRRERQRREHFLEMGARLVDNLNHLRQDVVAAVGQVRAVEERRAGQPARVVVGLVDLDLLAPGKQDVAARIRLRRLNLPLGSVLGEGREGEGAQDHVIPLARARLLDDTELLNWLFRNDQLVERRSIALLVPSWFDREVLSRLLKGMTSEHGGRGRIWDVEIDADAGDGAPLRPARLDLAIVLHPADLVEARRRALAEVTPLDREIADLDAALERVYARLREDGTADDRAALAAEKDRLKRARKALLDRRSAEMDRSVRHAARQQVSDLVQTATSWLLTHGCEQARTLC